jgi:hypothetical protein
MLESGIGRTHIIAMSVLPNFVLPVNVSASQRFGRNTSSSLKPKSLLRQPFACQKLPARVSRSSTSLDRQKKVNNPSTTSY